MADWIKMKTDSLIKDKKNYEEFIGEYGLFWNNGHEEYTIVDRLNEVETNSYDDIIFISLIGGADFDNFVPLTKEQLECLNLKN